MNPFFAIVDFIVHIDAHLAEIIARYGVWTYGILFVIVFCETGLVVTPLLPGDSLLFAAGAFAALGSLNPFIAFAVLFAAAVLGDSCNYMIGHRLGPAVLRKEDSRIFKKAYLDKTQHFYEKWGGRTIVFARFVPIVRTFAPFLAGVGAMHSGHFLTYNVIGGFLWTLLFVGGGYLFGNMPIVRDNFTLVILAIIAISLAPAVVGAVKDRLETARGEA